MVVRPEIPRWWMFFVSFASIPNAFMMVPQLWSVVSTRETAGISTIFLGVVVFLQATYTVHGRFLRDGPIMWSNGVACCFSTATFLTVLYLRGVFG